MKKSKFVVLPLLASFLAGCSNSSIVGNYVFQLGKTTGTHYGIYLNLTDEVLKDEATQELLGKKMDFDFALSGINGNPDPAKLAEYEAAKTVGEITLFALDTIAEESDIPEQAEIGNFSFSGYYVHNPELVEKDDEGNVIVPIGITSLKIELDDGSVLFEDKLGITPDILDKVIYNTWSGSTFTLVAPVSFDDALLQLYWYGIDFDFTTFEFKESEPHQVGTSPTKDDINRINQTYPDTHLGRKFRAFHKVHMGLSKV